MNCIKLLFWMVYTLTTYYVVCVRRNRMSYVKLCAENLKYEFSVFRNRYPYGATAIDVPISVETRATCLTECIGNDACVSLHVNETTDGVFCTLYESRIRWSTQVEGTTRSEIYIRGQVEHLMDDIPSMLKTFDFDDTSTTFSPEYTPSVGVSLRAINLTGSTDYVILGSDISSRCPFAVPECPDNFTISIWVKITEKSTYNYILHGPYIRLIQQNQANGRRIEAFYFLYDAGTSDRTKLEIKADHPFTLYDQWVHFVLLFSPSDIKLYINAEEVSVNLESTRQLNRPRPDYDDDPLVIGSARKEGDRTESVNAVIEVDELAGWTTELDDQQIKLLYDSYFS